MSERDNEIKANLEQSRNALDAATFVDAVGGIL